MIASLLAVVMMMAPASASEPRQAYSACLSKVAATGADKKMSTQEFEATLASSCASEEAAFRKSVIASDVSRGISRKTSEQGVEDEVAEYRAETRDRFASAMAAAPPSASTPPSTPETATAAVAPN